MTHDEQTNVEERSDAPVYEQPRIEDYGTLAELTAGKDGQRTDWFGQEEENGGGYS